ncbi:MFS transporter [Streptomyces adustus]|uniref:MFS transporter n=1 Tax=Streptomyces adustus TaxID=1609272 RepID=A0A5N8VCQ3_9ACTN|nr:MFS transporter [Streptomyces adustus]MPY31814.1 MFS transporter [Streptomyces adustus]
MASYLDAGSIVALGAGLTLFQTQLHLSSGAIGALAALGPNALGCAFGAFIGGRLGDRLGRKRIYRYDLLLYAAGMLVMALSVNAAMLFAGTVAVGVAVGADVPTSLALVGENAPPRARGKLLGLTQVAWNLGPVVVLLLAFVVAPLGLLGVRLVFLHLFLVAMVVWGLRRGVVESARWKSALAPGTITPRPRMLFRGANLAALAWTTTIYLFWNLAAGTSGSFTPYIVETLHAGSRAAGLALSSVGFVIGLATTVLLFMRFADRSHRIRKRMWALGGIFQVTAYVLFLVFPLGIPVILANIVLFGVGSALAGEGLYKVFSQELFPTLLRSTAQGFTFGAARTVLGVWSFLVPFLAHVGIRPLSALLALFLLVSAVVGYAFMPDTTGKTLERIEEERGTAAA